MFHTTKSTYSHYFAFQSLKHNIACMYILADMCVLVFCVVQFQFLLFFRKAICIWSRMLFCFFYKGSLHSPGLTLEWWCLPAVLRIVKRYSIGERTMNKRLLYCPRLRKYLSLVYNFFKDFWECWQKGNWSIIWRIVAAAIVERVLSTTWVHPPWSAPVLPSRVTMPYILWALATWVPRSHGQDVATPVWEQ